MPRKSKSSKQKQVKFIPAALYRRILGVMPIPCVDVVVVCRGTFLLVRRRNKPVRNVWWLVGGRVLKNERLHTAVTRKVKEEAGLANITIKKFLTTRETIFRTSVLGPSTHSVNSVFLVKVFSPKGIRPDGQSSDLRWFSHINKNWPPYVKDMLRLAGFR